MNKSILRLARRFMNRDLNRQLSFDSVEKYLRKAGFLILFYDDKENTDIIERYNLLEYSKGCDGFTINDEFDKYIFIRKTLSSQDMLYTLLHETGHIVLKHLDCNRTTTNKHIQEIEADAFAYGVLNNTKSNLSVYALIFSALLFITSCYNIVGANNVVQVSEPIEYIPAQTEYIFPEEEITTQVYVTPSGKKYHRPDCRYVKGKNCDSLSVADAYRKYTPCSVCRP